MLDRTPRIFISYSWTSEEYKQNVEYLASRMAKDGVDVKLDVWELKEGHDKFVFMEQCVTNPDIDKVLILCDKGYAEKADARKGGVGDETAIITPEIYGHASQEKFIPVVMERDDSGSPYLPVYLKSRMYKDFSGEHYEDEYKSLMRNIFEQPAKRKPKIGIPPKWLTEEEPVTILPLKEAVNRVLRAHTSRECVAASQEFLNEYISSLKPFYKRKYTPYQEYLDDFAAMKENRDIFLEYIKALSGMEDLGEHLADIFERLYNTLYCVRTFDPDANNCNTDSFDIFRLHVWELFICTVTYLLYIEDYHDINGLLTHTYFLRRHALDDKTTVCNYEMLRFHSRMLEEKIKPKLPDDLSRKYTLTGHLLCTERECLPIFTGTKMAEADLFLYQVYNALQLDSTAQLGGWFPTCYIYAPEDDSIWRKLVSKRFCKKIFPLFGVSSIDELKERLKKCEFDRRYRYSEGHVYPATAILSWIDIQNVAMYP